MTDHPATEPDLFSWPGRPAPEAAFDGKTYDAARDFERLDCQLGRVWRLMKDGQWRTLEHIRFVVGGSDASVSARLRDLRKPKYGARTVERRHVRDGCFEYRLKDVAGNDTSRVGGRGEAPPSRDQANPERQRG
jgi:hypothetical protein